MESDIVLLERFLSGDEEAFKEIVERYQKMIYTIALKIIEDPDEAKDIAQRAFIQAFKKARSFEGRSSFKTWLYRIVINLSRNYLRDRKTHEPVENYHHIYADKDQLETLCEAEKNRLVEEAIKTLPHKQRLTLYLRVYGGLSFKEIAHIMECAHATAKVNYHHAIYNLKDKLKEYME